MKPNNLIQKHDVHIATTATDSPNGSGDQQHRRIAAAAFALYERRGRQDGHELDDWLAAEQQILLVEVAKTFEVAQRTDREARLRRENARLKRLVGELISELNNNEEVWA
ncbi:MAG TPA: DUF2934 domain-containing protein [Nitrospira sp.]|nr:DUF2934 domain-containing protein [Nitrospira sp.]